MIGVWIAFEIDLSVEKMISGALYPATLLVHFLLYSLMHNSYIWQSFENTISNHVPLVSTDIN